MTETEIKSMIDKDLYKSILNAFTWEKVREQTNYYYTDKAGILREKRIMVRIRVVGEVAKIQVKLHKNENSPFGALLKSLHSNAALKYNIDSLAPTHHRTFAVKRSGSAPVLLCCLHIQRCLVPDSFALFLASDSRLFFR